MWAQTDTGVTVGADSIGELRKMAEDVGKEKLVEMLKQAGSASLAADTLT